jgi:HIRAN domain
MVSHSHPTARTRPIGRRQRPLKSTKLSDLPIDEPGCVDLGSGHDCYMGVVGESTRQGVLRLIDEGRRRKGQQVTFVAELILEPDNPYDAKAVKVCGPKQETLGYLSREDARQYQTALRALARSGRRGRCRAKLIGGTEDKPSLGVMIDLRSPEDLLEHVASQPF